MSSTEAMLGRIRSALTDVTPMAPADDVAVDWTYGQRPPGASDDMLGLFTDFHPKFVKRYAELGETADAAIAAYAADVRARRFPGPEHSFGAGTPA